LAHHEQDATVFQLQKELRPFVLDLLNLDGIDDADAPFLELQGLKVAGVAREGPATARPPSSSSTGWWSA
jgi:hypothetical protein